MSFELASAYVELTNRGFRTVTGEIDKVRSKLGDLTNFAGGPLATAFGTAIGSMGASLVAGFAGKIAGAGSSMLKLAADAEQAEVAFATMLGSTEAAKKMLEDLQSFASSTPFELPGIKQAARTLMAFGTSQDQVIPLLRVLGDVSSGTGKDLSELAVIFGQISATGKLTGGDLMQLTNAGVPMLKVLGDQLGKTTGEVKAMVEGGEISAGMVTRAFQSMSSEGGLFAQMMQKQSGTLTGVWSTFNDSLGVIMTDVGDAIIEGFDLRSVIADMTGFAERFRSEWMPTIVNTFQWVSGNIVGPWMNAMGQIGSAVGNLVGAVTSQFDRLFAGVEGRAGGFFKWLIDGYYGTFAGIIDSVANFVADFDLYWDLAATSLGNSLNNMYQIFTTNLSNMWTTTKWFFDNFGAIAYNTVENFGTIFGNVFKQIRNNWESLLNFFSTGKLEFDFSPVRDSLNAMFEGVKLPKLEAPQLDSLRSDMDRIEQQLAKRQADRLNARNKAMVETTKAQESQLKITDDIATGAKAAGDQEKKKTKELKSQTAEQKEQTAEQKKQSAGFVSLADLADQMQTRVLEMNTKKAEQVAPADAGNEGFAAKAMRVGGEIAGNLGQQVIPSETLSNAMATIQDKFKSVASVLRLPSIAPVEPSADSGPAASVAPPQVSPIASLVNQAGSSIRNVELGPQLAAISRTLERIEALATGDGIGAKIKNFPQSRVGQDPASWQFGNA